MTTNPLPSFNKVVQARYAVEICIALIRYDNPNRSETNDIEQLLMYEAGRAMSNPDEWSVAELEGVLAMTDGATSLFEIAQFIYFGQVSIEDVLGADTLSTMDQLRDITPELWPNGRGAE